MNFEYLPDEMKISVSLLTAHQVQRRLEMMMQRVCRV